MVFCRKILNNSLCQQTKKLESLTGWMNVVNGFDRFVRSNPFRKPSRFDTLTWLQRLNSFFYRSETGVNPIGIEFRMASRTNIARPFQHNTLRILTKRMFSKRIQKRKFKILFGGPDYRKFRITVDRIR